MADIAAFMERFRGIAHIYTVIIEAGFSLLYIVIAPLTTYMAYLYFFKMGGGEKYHYVGAALCLLSALFLWGAYTGLRDARRLYREYVPPASPENERMPIDSRKGSQFETL
ncbi:MAG: hypothetical protein C0436_05485 [Alphaproteobacteria bacterium]|nr:hypothetical protein [Alphaproteobacteria bacterium]